MPHFTFPLSPDGPIVPGLVGLNDQETATLANTGKPIPRPISIRALLDTACDMTAIDPRLPRQLGLVPVRQVRTQTAAGPVQAAIYSVSLSIYGPSGAAGALLVRSSLEVTELAVSLPDAEVLIGLDVLGECLFILDGPGKQFLLGF